MKPTKSTSGEPPMTPHRVGDYRQVTAAAPAAPPAQPSPGVAADQFVRSSKAPQPPQVAPAAAPLGLWERLKAWFQKFFGPAEPIIIEPPKPPVTPPVTPPTPPVAPSTGMQAFFTNTPAGALTGMTNEQVNEANEHAAMADPNNPDKQLVAFIDSVQAGGTLDGAFFDIEVPNVVDALVRAKQRGVNVRLVTETDYYNTSSGTELREPIKKLQAAGIEIKPDGRQSALMHDKFLVANGQKVWTGSYNITSHGSYRENNNALLIDSPELASQFQHEFNKMFAHGNFATDTNNGNPLDDHPAPKTVKVGDAEVTTYFSPSTAAQAGAKGAIMDELRNAKKSIQFLAFSFTDDDMGDLMLQKAAAGVKVEGVFEKSQAASRYSEFKKLDPQEAALNGNLDVRIDTNPALMHHKVMIIDDETLIMGSFNFSASAQGENNENMLVIKNSPELVAKYKAEFERIQKLSA